MFRKILAGLTKLSVGPTVRAGLTRGQNPGRSRIEDNAAALAEELRQRFGIYTTARLRGIGRTEFQEHIQRCLGAVDPAAEGYFDAELDRQRDLSIKFHWGHNHDFGDFKLDGRLGDRHLELLAHFLALFPLTWEDFAGKEVLDVGCWTGGTTLLLAALGSRVVALEEVKKYADMASFLMRSFGLEERVRVEAISLFSCNTEIWFDRFDLVYFPGVIYHLTDPLIALRVLFNTLKVGGAILVESAGIDHPEPLCRFDGSLIWHAGSRERLDRAGWNWFLPSASALLRMMREAGFDDVKTLWHQGHRRVYGYGKKLAQTGICRAGLSFPNIR